jgi:hypothetical protein
MLFHYLLPDILYFFMLIPQHIVPIRLKLSRGIFDFFEIFLRGVSEERKRGA